MAHNSRRDKTWRKRSLVSGIMSRSLRVSYSTPSVPSLRSVIATILASGLSSTVLSREGRFAGSIDERIAASVSRGYLAFLIVVYLLDSHLDRVVAFRNTPIYRYFSLVLSRRMKRIARTSANMHFHHCSISRRRLLRSVDDCCITIAVPLPAYTFARVRCLSSTCFSGS